MKRFGLFCLFVAGVLTLLSATGAKETKVKYPNGDITFVNPNAPGGGNDLLMRALIPGMKAYLGVNIIPENKPASRGAVAAMEITNAKPDGQKIYINSQTLLLMPYGGIDVKIEGFQPVAQIVEDTGVVLVKADAPYKTIQEFVDAAKKAKLKVAHNGSGSLWHLAAVMFAKAAKVDFQYVVYTGGGTPMMTATAAGEVDMVIVNPAESKPLIDAGKIKPLAVMSEGKHPMLTQVPTCIEAGIPVTFPVWRGIFTTKGTSEEILSILDKAVKAGTEGEEFKKLVQTTGLEIKYRDHKEFTKFFEEQKELTAQLMKEIGIK